MHMQLAMKRQWQDWANLILGVWLIIAPFLLDFGGTDSRAAVNAYVMGVGVTIFAVAALYRPPTWEEGINLAIGIWLIIAPFVLGYTGLTMATWIHVIVGLLVGGDALLALFQRPRHPTTV
jgi:hypothetical protein